MKLESVVVSPEEVRAFAHFPGRSLVGMGALLALAVALLLWAVRSPPLPPLALPPPFDPQPCAVSPVPSDCLARLPIELQKLPDGDQYSRWRLFDVVAALELPVQPSRLSLSQRAELTFEAMVLKHRLPRTRAPQGRVELALVRRDGWVKGQQARKLLGSWDWLAQDELPSLQTLAGERDWSQPPPPLPPVPTQEEIDAQGLPAEERLLAYVALYRNLETREVAAPYLAELAQQLEQERLALFQKQWLQMAAAEQAEQQRLVEEHQRKVQQREAQVTSSWVLAGAGLLLLLLWACLRPRAVVVGLHQLQLGRRSLPWNEVLSFDWGAEPPYVHARTGRYTLGWHVLPPEAIEPLTRASAQARQRAASLGPVDQAALDSVRRLRQ